MTELAPQNNEKPQKDKASLEDFDAQGLLRLRYAQRDAEVTSDLDGADYETELRKNIAQEFDLNNIDPAVAYNMDLDELNDFADEAYNIWKSSDDAKELEGGLNYDYQDYEPSSEEIDSKADAAEDSLSDRQLQEKIVAEVEAQTAKNLEEITAGTYKDGLVKVKPSLAPRVAKIDAIKQALSSNGEQVNIGENIAAELRYAEIERQLKAAKLADFDRLTKEFVELAAATPDGIKNDTVLKMAEEIEQKAGEMLPANNSEQADKADEASQSSAEAKEPDLSTDENLESSEAAAESQAESGQTLDGLRELATHIQDLRYKLEQNNSKTLSKEVFSNRYFLNREIAKYSDILQDELAKLEKSSNDEAEIKELYDILNSSTESRSRKSDEAEPAAVNPAEVVETNGSHAAELEPQKLSRLKKLGAFASTLYIKADQKVREGLIFLSQRSPFQAKEQQADESDADYKERLERRGALKGAAAAGVLLVGAAAVAAIGRQMGLFDGTEANGPNMSYLRIGEDSNGNPSVVSERPSAPSSAEANNLSPHEAAGTENPEMSGSNDNESDDHLDVDTGLDTPVPDRELGGDLESNPYYDQYEGSVDRSDAEVSVASFTNITEGEGWYRTIKEMGVDESLLDVVTKEAGPRLVDMGIGYQDPEIGGCFGIARTGEMPQEAIDILIESAEKVGAGMSDDVKKLHSRY